MNRRGDVDWSLILVALFLVTFGVGVAIGAQHIKRPEELVLEAQRDQLTATLHIAHQRNRAMQDSVLAGEVAGFHVRCYWVKEE